MATTTVNGMTLYKSVYSSETLEALLRMYVDGTLQTDLHYIRPSNPNLLDNWYFADPINQREVESGEVWAAGSYGLDRWMTFNASIYWDDNGYLVFPVKTATNDNLLRQRIELERLVPGTTMCLSVLADDGQLYSATFSYQGSTVYGLLSGTPFGMSALYVTDSYVEVRVWGSNDETVPHYLWAVKLELGETQTLAHQDADGNWVLNDPPPNKALELTKCQRYQAIIRANLAMGISNGTTVYAPCALPVPLRAKPTVTVNNATLYRGVSGEHISVSHVYAFNCSENIVYLAIGTNTPFSAGTAALVEIQSDGAYIIFDANL